MKQRVGIARGVTLSRRLTLQNEPFGMLDSLTRWDLQNYLMKDRDSTKVPQFTKPLNWMK